MHQIRKCLDQIWKLINQIQKGLNQIWKCLNQISPSLNEMLKTFNKMSQIKWNVRELSFAKCMKWNMKYEMRKGKWNFEDEYNMKINFQIKYN